MSDRNTLDKNAVVSGSFGFRVDGKHNVLEGNTANNTSGSGVLVMGDSNRLGQNAAAFNENEGFRVVGASNQLTRNTARLNETNGFTIEGDKTVARDNEAIENLGDGFSIFGSESRFTLNTVRLNGSNGFVADGKGHRFIQNTATDSMHAGFIVFFGTGSVFTKNVATANGEEGIRLQLGATGHTLKGNEAFGNGGSSQEDLHDANPLCDSNVWKQNNFGTSNQGCID